MEKYDKLVEALRCDWMPDDSCKRKCPYADSHGYCDMDKVRSSAADAIEALQAQLPKRGKWVETEEKEWGIYPFKKQTCSVCDCKIDHIFMLACMDYFDDRDTVFHYCPNCGAKMEVQDGQ